MLKKAAIVFACILLLTFLGCSGNSKPSPALNPAPNPVNGEKVASEVQRLVDRQFPGSWTVAGNSTLQKGSYTENNNYHIVDLVSKAYPGSMVSLFAGGKRIASSVRGSTMIDSQLPEEVAETLKTGKIVVVNSGSINSKDYRKIFLPLKAANLPVAVMSISLPN